MVFAQYTWVMGLSVVAAFASAFGIGANDVANSFATSVASRALTLFQAVCVAGIFEFLGAILLGASVTDTIKNSIAKTSAFSTAPALLLYGMFCALCTSALWDNLACHLGLAVSTSHTIIGSIIGMAIAINGFDAVLWSANAPAFPFIKGVVPVFLSWVCSPLCAAILVTIVYGIIVRPFVLRSKNPYTRAVRVVPVLIGLTFFVIVIFIIQTGNKNKTWATTFVLWKAMVVSVAIGIAAFLFAQFVVMPVLTARVNRAHKKMQREMHTATMADGVTMKDSPNQSFEDGKGPVADVEHGKVPADVENAAATNTIHPADHQTLDKEDDYLLVERVLNKISSVLSRTLDVTGLRKFGRWLTQFSLVKLFMYGSTYQIQNVTKEGHKDFNADMVQIQAHAEVFDWRTERLFSYAQVCSACVMSFAHGANDVANAMGPFAAIYAIWSTSAIPSKSNVPEWILVVGGAGIVCGLALYGHKIMRVLGCEMVLLTCARGFSVELSTAIVVMVASYSGLPVSTTQTVTGAIIAVGCFEGVRGVNWKIVGKTFCGWILTIVLTALFCAGLTSLAVYAPNKPGVYDTNYVTGRLDGLVGNIVREVNGSNRALPTPNPALTRSIAALNSTLTAYLKAKVKLPRKEMDLFSQAFTVYNQSTGITL